MSVTFYGLRIDNIKASKVGETILKIGKETITAPVGLVKSINEINHREITEISEICSANFEISIRTGLTIINEIVSYKLAKKYAPKILSLAKKHWKKAAIAGGLYGLGELLLHEHYAHYKQDQYFNAKNESSCPYKKKSPTEKKDLNIN